MPEKENPSDSIFQEFFKSYQRSPEHTAVIFRKGQSYHGYSYSHLFRSSKKLACAISLMRVKKGQRIAILMENGPAWPVAFLSIVCIQAVAVPIDTQLDINQIKDIINHSQSVLVITQSKFVEKFGDQLKTLKRVKVIDLDSFVSLEEALRFENVPMNIGMNQNKLAALFYTSGTTGNFKAVMLTHRNLLANYRSIKEMKIFSSEDVIISILPLHHTYSFMTTCLAPLLEGLTICYPGSISFKDVSSCMQQNGVTLFVAVPQFFHKICAMIDEQIKKKPLPVRSLLMLVINCCWLLSKVTKKNYSNLILKDAHILFGDRLRFMISGGARLDPIANLRLEKFGFRIVEGYGLTETSPVVAFNPLGRSRIGSVGKPIPGVRVKLFNKNAEGFGEVGVRGDNVMLGYYRLPDNTAKVFNRDWFLSGDLGYFDRRGYLYLAGRNNDIIVLSSGKNINPEELERHYSDRCIKEICIIAQKGTVYGQNKQITAIVVPDEEYIRQSGEPDIKGRVKWILDGRSQQLPPYKRISGFTLIKTELPKTRLGKIKRYEVIEKFNQGVLQEQAEAEGQEPVSLFEKNALVYLSGFLKKPLKMSDHFELDLGLDSLDRIELLSALQDLFSVEVSDDVALKIFGARTVGELIRISQEIVTGDAFEKLKHKDENIFWAEVFQVNPLRETINSLKLYFNLLDKFVSLVLAILIKSFLKVFFFLKVEGRSNIPKKGPFIIVANHTTYLDGLIVVASLPFKLILNTYFVGLGAIFRHFLLSWTIRLCRIIPIDLNVNLAETLKACNFLLGRGKALCYFPEGLRSADGMLTTFKKGIGILIKEATVEGLCVLPIYIDGAYEAWGRHIRFPRFSRIRVIIAPPLKKEDLVIKNVKAPYEAIADNLRIKIATIREQVSRK